MPLSRTKTENADNHSKTHNVRTSKKNNICTHRLSIFFFFNDTATTEIYTLSLHDALPILQGKPQRNREVTQTVYSSFLACPEDRKSTRLNSSHLGISYAVFCLKKKKKA